MSKHKIQNFKLSEDDFKSLSVLEKREYFLQLQQEETNDWVRKAAKIYVITFYIVLVITSITCLLYFSQSINN